MAQVARMTPRYNDTTPMLNDMAERQTQAHRHKSRDVDESYTGQTLDDDSRWNDTAVAQTHKTDPAAGPLAQMTGAEVTAVTARIAGTRIGVAIDDILRYARDEIDPWLDAAVKSCDSAPADRAKALHSLVQARCENLRTRMDKLYKVARAMDYLDAHRASLRNQRRAVQRERDNTRNVAELRALIRKHDTISTELLETERRRAEAIAESIRMVIGSCSAARALYAQIDVLANGKQA